MRVGGHMRRRVVSTVQGSALILMYHRIAESAPELDPEKLTIAAEHFEKQLAAFVETFTIMSLSEVVTRLQEKRRLPVQTLCLTFDDGYEDNFEIALPILERYEVPATFFIAGAGLNNEHIYLWEEHAPELYKHANTELLARTSGHPLVEIGGHTQTHPRLTVLAPEEQTQEISENKRMLEKITRQPVTLFAYPFGQLNDFNVTSVAAVKACGYEAACTTISGLVEQRGDLYRLPREYVGDMAAEEAVDYLHHAFGY